MVVGVVGKGEGGVGLVAVLRAGGEGPAGKHGDVSLFEGTDLFGANGIGGRDEDVAGREGAFEFWGREDT